MSRDDLSMWDDPDESPVVRQLLRAGRSVRMERDYDVERGLAQHLANLRASAAPPPWAAGMVAPKVAATTSLLAWLLPPIVGAGMLGAWLLVRPAEPSTPSLRPVNAPTSDESSTQSGTAAANAPSSSAEPSGLPSAAEPVQLAMNALSPAANSANPDEAPRNRTQNQNLVRSAMRSTKSTTHRALLTHTSDVLSAHHDARDANTIRTRKAETSLEVTAPVASNANAIPTAASDAPSADFAANTMNPARAQPASTSSAEVRQPVEAAPSSEPKPVAAARAVADAKVAEPARVSESDSKLEREMQMLAVAQRVLIDDPARALRLTRQGEQEFRGSMFSAERKQVSLLALVQLGRLGEARRLAVPFLRAYPNAPWSARLREALSTGRLPAR